MTNNTESFRIIHSHGLTETGIQTYDAAVAKVREVYGTDCEIGHSGDLEDGGGKTLCWQDTASAANDDGSLACCSIRQSHASCEDE